VYAHSNVFKDVVLDESLCSKAGVDAGYGDVKTVVAESPVMLSVLKGLF